MRSLKIKEVTCVICNTTMRAKKAQKNRCLVCRQKYLQEYRKQPEVRAKRAKRLRELREQTLAGYGNRCQCCGETILEFLCIDHVNGGGRQDRRVRSTWQIATDIIRRNFPPEYRVLCHNCNQSIGWYGGCPHNTNWKRTA